MNATEFKTFCDDAFAAFPGLYEWVHEKSPSPAKTIAVWSKTLSQVNLLEALGVLAGWVDGTIKDPPVGFRREMFALDVRAIVARRRDKIRSEQSQASISKHDSENRVHRVRLSPFVNRMLSAGQKWRDGFISEQECDEQIQNALSDGYAALDAGGVR